MVLASELESLPVPEGTRVAQPEQDLLKPASLPASAKHFDFRNSHNVGKAPQLGQMTRQITKQASLLTLDRENRCLTYLLLHPFEHQRL